MKSLRKPDPARPYIAALYAHNRLRFATVAALDCALQLMVLLISWILGAVVDAIAAADMAALGNILRVTVLSTIVMLASELACERLRADFLRRAAVQYKAEAFKALCHKSISAFTKERSGRYIALLTSDAEKVQENYLNATLWLIPQPVLVAGSLLMMLRLSPELTLATALLSLLPVTGSAMLAPGLARRECALSDENERFTGRIKDLLTGFAVIKSFKAERETAKVFAGANAAVESARARRRWWAGALNSAAQALSIVAQLGIFFTGAYLAIARGSVSAGTVILFVNLSGSLLYPLQSMPRYLADRKAARALIGKLATVAAENTAHTGAPVEPVLRNGIALSHLTYGYEPDKPVLRDVSMRLEAGRKYALVGASGAGKSTLLELLMGGCSGYAGSVTVDGRELRGIDPDSLYDLISLIDQNVFIFDDTLQNNMTMFRDFPPEQVQSAAARAGLTAFIQARGADYRCGESGSALSGGERQRVSIARALLHGTPVLLLDEATAALDNATAATVTGSILDLEGLTRLIVTHRLDKALLERCDKIFVLRGGQITEQGTFAALMAHKGYFYSLYTIGAVERTSSQKYT